MNLPDIKKVTQDLLQQTDSILGALMVINAAVSKLSQGADLTGKFDVKEDMPVDDKESELASQPNGLVLDKKEAEEMRELFSTAESAMEAWAMLANALGHPTFIKSEFEKICFLDNVSTDTQMRREKELIEKILNTEINIFRSIRDGSALMQHMEYFYYISLLENVRSNYQIVGGTEPVTDQKLSI